MIKGSVLRTEVFSAKQCQHLPVNSQILKDNLQSWGSLSTELTMKDEYSLLRRIIANGRYRFTCSYAKKVLFYASRGIDVDSTRYVPANIFVVEPTVDYMKTVELRGIETVKKVVELRRG